LLVVSRRLFISVNSFSSSSTFLLVVVNAF
jgi:hypothetical protein